MAKMDNQQLVAVLKNQVEDALNYYDTDLSAFRMDVQDYYNSEQFGNEQDGKSKVVTSDLQEVIEQIMPSLMRIFTSSKDYIKFLPRNQEDVAGAEQSSIYANYVIEKNNGFTMFHNWFKSALLFKMGVVKFFYDESESVVEEEYTGLTLDQLTAMLQDDSLEIVEQEERPFTEEPPQQTMDATGNVVTIPIPNVYDVKIKKKKTSGEIKVIQIPEEEFLIQRHCKSIDDADFVCHRREMSVGELVAMGYDVDEIRQYASGGGEIDQEQERRNRFEDIDGGTTETDNIDPSQEKVIYNEIYLKVDFDNDDIPELRRICTVGSGYHILMNEPFDHIPFATLSPILMPHRLIGQSVAESLMDIQLIKSTVLRQILDNLYLSNNTRLVVQDGAVNIDDILNNVAGGLIRTKTPGAVQPLNTPLVAQSAFPMLEYLDQLKESRTGLNKASMGLDPQVLQSTTASAVNQIVSASQGKIELIARVFAETGVKDLFKGILFLASKHATQTEMVRLNNTFIPVDPRNWSTSYDVQVNVGLGTGQTNEKLAVLTNIQKTQEQILLTLGANNPLVNLKQYRETLAKILSLSGYKNSNEFFLDPIQQPEMEQQPSEEEQKVSAERFKAEQEIALKKQKMEADIQLAREKLQAELELKRLELESELRLRGQAQLLGNKEVSQNL